MRSRSIGRIFLSLGVGGMTMLAWGAGQTQDASQQAPSQSVVQTAATTDAGASAGGAHAAFPGLDKADQYWAFLEQYCTECHNAEDWAGSIAFDTMTPDQVPEEAEVWEKVVRKLRGRLMPPPGEPHPDQEAYVSFISWMESYLDHAAASRSDPGRVGLHRLNRKEYANAVRDLLALEIDPATLLPPDDISDGFDNVANVLQVSPSFMEQYLNAARTIAVQAIGKPDARPSGAAYVATDTGTQQLHRPGLPLGTRGGFAVDHYFPADGEYEINIGNMAAALWVYNMEFENTVLVTLDGVKVFETTIGGEEDMKAIDQEQDPAVDRINQRLKNIRFKAKAGVHKVGVTFLARTLAESEDRLQPLIPGTPMDRILRVGTFEIRGPFRTEGVSETPSRKAIFTCYPQSAAEEQLCAESIITRLATRAFRRPVNDADMANLMRFYRDGHERGGFEEGIRTALTAILADPYFLYRVERTPKDAQPGELYRISDIELASKLSFFLWSSLPDEELLQLAVQNRLHEPQVLEQQVRRMLADPRADTLVSNFAFQWLNVAKLAEVEPDPAIFPYASSASNAGSASQGDPRPDFREELRLFIRSIFREDRSVLDLLTADHTYVNERLALLYDIPDVKGSQFRRIQLRDPDRFGLLGKGAILMASAYPNRTSPVLRGAYVLENIIGTPPAAPPPNVEALPENQEGAKTVRTVRELLEHHRANPSCNSCHGVIDPLGFALERFDAVGVKRRKDRFAGTPIDTLTTLADGTQVDGPVDLRNAILRTPDQFVQTFTEKLMTYALGRTVESHDMPTVRAIVRETAKDDYRFSSIVLAIVRSAPFQMRRVNAGDDGQPAEQLVRNVSEK